LSQQHWIYMNKIEINKASYKNFDLFYQFFTKKVKEYFSDEYTSKTFNHFFNKTFTKKAVRQSIKNGDLFLAKENDRLVGFLLKLEPHKYGVDYADWLAVDKNYRNRVIATKLLKSWEEDAIKKGVHCLMITTEERNINFYKKRGFIYMGKIPKGYAGAEDYYFYKPTQEPKEENYLR